MMQYFINQTHFIELLNIFFFALIFGIGFCIEWIGRTQVWKPLQNLKDIIRSQGRPIRGESAPYLDTPGEIGDIARELSTHFIAYEKSTIPRLDAPPTDDLLIVADVHATPRFNDKDALDSLNARLEDLNHKIQALSGDHAALNIPQTPPTPPEMKPSDGQFTSMIQNINREAALINEASVTWGQDYDTPTLQLTPMQTGPDTPKGPLWQPDTPLPLFLRGHDSTTDETKDR